MIENHNIPHMKLLDEPYIIYVLYVFYGTYHKFYYKICDSYKITSYNPCLMFYYVIKLPKCFSKSNLSMILVKIFLWVMNYNQFNPYQYVWKLNLKDF